MGCLILVPIVGGVPLKTASSCSFFVGVMRRNQQEQGAPFFPIVAGVWENAGSSEI